MSARVGDKVALVTGAGSGIGRETVRLLAAEGARVACLDIDPTRVDEIVAELAAAGHEAHGHCCDVSDPSACNGAVAATLERFGRLDVLCNVAGISMMRTIDAVDDALWNRMIGVNLAGPFYLCRAAVPALVESHGNIVNVASQAGLRGYSHLSAYAAAKGGLVMLTRALAVELAPHNVRVNCVCPGAVLTNIADSIEVGGAFDSQVTTGDDAAQPEDLAARGRCPRDRLPGLRRCEFSDGRRVAHRRRLDGLRPPARRIQQWPPEPYAGPRFERGGGATSSP